MGKRCLPYYITGASYIIQRLTLKVGFTSSQYSRKTMTQLGTISAGRGFPCAAAGALAILTAVFLSGCGQHQGGPPGGMGGFSIPVTAQPMKRGPIDQSFTVSATVAPLQHAVLSSVIPGTILVVNGQIGQHVSKGDLLVQIDDSTLQAQLNQNDALLAAAQARYASARANASGTMSSSDAGLASAKSAADSADAELRRDLALLKQGYVSQQVVDQQQAAAAAADAALRSAEVQATNASLSGTSSSALADLRTVARGRRERRRRRGRWPISRPTRRSERG
jgi:multidrug efflux pump subunit AcrA (membrane-fusion protein)